MSWNDIPQPERTQLQHRLTDKQLLVYMLRHNGTRWETIAWMLTLSIRTIRTHHFAATIKHQQIRDELGITKDAAA